MQDKDALWFLQMLYPICDPKESGIEGDNRVPYYSHVTACTNIYAVGEKGWGGGRGHTYHNVSEAELVRWTGVQIRHGAREGRSGGYHQRWSPDDSNFDALIANNMTPSPFRQINPVFKLNNNLTSPQPGQEGYDPCAKYDHIFMATCHNMNYATEYADMDYAVDESTWGFMGYMGECGGRLRNKPKGKGECVLSKSITAIFGIL